MRLWIKNPLAMLAAGADGGIVVQGGKIVELVGRGQVPEHDHAFDASAHVVLPGLINTHHHFYQTLTRANPQAINKELFDWLKALYPIWARLNPETHRLGTRLALTELLMSGVTTTSDHHYVFPPGLDDAMDIQVEEARSLGVRMMVTRGSMNLSQKDGGLPPDSVVQDRDTILADCDRVIGKYHERGDGAQIQIALAPCSPFSVTRELMRETAALAEKRDCRLHTHLAETMTRMNSASQPSKCDHWIIWKIVAGCRIGHGLRTVYTSTIKTSYAWGGIALAFATAPHPT